MNLEELKHSYHSREVSGGEVWMAQGLRTGLKVQGLEQDKTVLEIHREQEEDGMEETLGGSNGKAPHKKCHEVNNYICSDQRWWWKQEEKEVVAFLLNKIIQH